MRVRWCDADTEVFREKVIVRLSAGSSEGLAVLVILDKGTVDHSYYIKNVLPVAFKYGNEVFADKRLL